jgi:hypothetical protein
MITRKIDFNRHREQPPALVHPSTVLARGTRAAWRPIGALGFLDLPGPDGSIWLTDILLMVFLLAADLRP